MKYILTLPPEYDGRTRIISTAVGLLAIHPEQKPMKITAEGLKPLPDLEDDSFVYGPRPKKTYAKTYVKNP